MRGAWEPRGRRISSTNLVILDVSIVYNEHGKRSFEKDDSECVRWKFIGVCQGVAATKKWRLVLKSSQGREWPKPTEDSKSTEGKGSCIRN